MAVQTSYPGVYIDEFAPGAPIQGVGTSTTAFLGPTARGEIAARGDLRLIGKITSWERFQQEYGDAPLPGFHLWYAVRGFFENGGQICYVARVSNGGYQDLILTDRSAGGNDLVRVRARQPGIPGTNITVAVQGKNLITAGATSVFQPTGQLNVAPAGRELTLNAGQGANFRPDDEITIGGAGERARIVRVSGDALRIGSDLTGVYAAGAAVRLADVVAGTRTIRIRSTLANIATLLIPGTLLTITQGVTTDSQIVETVRPEFLGGGVVTYRVTFRRGLDVPINMGAAAAVRSEEFDITIAQGGSTLYDDLAIDAAHPRYYLNIINGDRNALVRLEPVEPPPAVDVPVSLPSNLAATPLAGGAIEDLTALTANHYIEALNTLQRIEDINLVAAPDATIRLSAGDTATVQQAMITHCETMAFRFAVLDSRPGLDLFGGTSVENQRLGLASARGHAGLYYPWIRVLPVGSGEAILVPPSGHVCGIMARSDATRGVHKAPANELVSGVVGVERTMSDIDQGQLNLAGINVIRIFSPGGRATLWGARTTARDTNWQYVNIRRLFNFLEASIERGILWAVFEPNNLALWQKLRRTLTDFLRQQWRDGALFGEEPDDAFYVRIDELLNPFSEQALGRLHIEIGVRPSYPAEFIIVHIGIWQGGSEVSEG
jgi:phage tail sheath protein FI